MANAILGRKVGMTQVFSATGEARGVTVVEAGPCVVVQIKTEERDGYNAIQIGFGQRKRVNDAQKGHMKQLGQFRYLREVRVEGTQRIEPETVRSYLTLNPGDPFDPVLIDQSLKSIFATDPPGTPTTMWRPPVATTLWLPSR